jgi:phosphoglycolate phosphatase-like HAD superfamily hydrolase
MTSAGATRAVLLDIDGTLVDTAYYHAIAWARAFRDHDLDVPVWRLHRHVGMGGDKLVAAVAGDQIERDLGDAVRASWEERFDVLLPEIRSFDGAAGVADRLEAQGFTVVLATSAIARHADAFLRILGIERLRPMTVTKEDVSASKPEPDVVISALDRAATRHAVLVGDTVWDGEAATRAGIPFIGVLTGGFAASELEGAGAVSVLEQVADVPAAVASALAA